MNVLSYSLKRLIAALPIVLGVNLLTFLLFFVMKSPDDLARRNLPVNKSTQADITRWKVAHGYNLPRFVNSEEEGLSTVTQTLFCQKTMGLLVFDFGQSDSDGTSIALNIREKMWPSFCITLPMMALTLLAGLSGALFVVFYRGSYLDHWTLVVTVTSMSISMLFYIIGGQYLLGRLLKLFPISGFSYDGDAGRFIVMPVLIGTVAGVGVAVRFYRTVFLEEINKDYIRTARAKGVAEKWVLFKHCLKNAMIPILTDVIMYLPFLFMGTFLLEVFFGIPGLGDYTIKGIQGNDFAVVRSMTYLGSLLYILGLIATDISYTLVDPRIVLK